MRYIIYLFIFYLYPGWVNLKLRYMLYIYIYKIKFSYILIFKLRCTIYQFFYFYILILLNKFFIIKFKLFLKNKNFKNIL